MICSRCVTKDQGVDQDGVWSRRKVQIDWKVALMFPVSVHKLICSTIFKRFLNLFFDVVYVRSAIQGHDQISHAAR